MPLLYLDTETTGLSASYDEIVQIGVVDEDGQVLMDTLIRPVRNTSWPEAEAIHGITPQMVASAPALDEVLPALTDIVRGQHVVIYNAGFDCGFLPVVNEVAARIDCCMLAYAEHIGDWHDYYGNYRWHRLVDAAKHLRHDLSQAHNAVADALACRAVWRYLTIPAVQEALQAIWDAEQREREIGWEVAQIEREQLEAEKAAAARAGTALMRRIGCGVRACNVARSPGERTQRQEEYARLFFGKPSKVLDLEDCLRREISGYSRRKDVPPHLKTIRHFDHLPLWIRDKLHITAYVATAATCSWLYDERQITEIRARYPLRNDYEARPGYWLAYRTDLKNMGYKDAWIDTLHPVKEVEYYTGKWTVLYEVPRDLPVLRKPRQKTADTHIQWGRPGDVGGS